MCSSDYTGQPENAPKIEAKRAVKQNKPGFPKQEIPALVMQYRKTRYNTFAVDFLQFNDTAKKTAVTSFRDCSLFSWLFYSGFFIFYAGYQGVIQRYDKMFDEDPEAAKILLNLSVI